MDWDDTSCNDLYYVVCESRSFIKCLPKQCTCTNGEPSVGIDCPEDGEENCSTCNDGYTLSKCNTCEPKYHVSSTKFQFDEAVNYCKSKQNMQIATVLRDRKLRRFL